MHELATLRNPSLVVQEILQFCTRPSQPVFGHTFSHFWSNQLLHQFAKRSRKAQE